MKNAYQHGYPLFYMFQLYQTSKSQGYRRVVILCATIEPDDVDLGICADGPLGTSSDWRCNRSLPWAAKAGKKKDGLVERLEPMGTCIKSRRNGYDMNQPNIRILKAQKRLAHDLMEFSQQCANTYQDKKNWDSKIDKSNFRRITAEGEFSCLAIA